MDVYLGRYYLFILYTTWLVPRWDRTTKITVLPVYKLFIYGWPDVVVCCIKMIFLRCCLEDSNSSCVFVDFCSHRGRLEGLRPNQIVLMPMTWLPRDPILRFVFRFKLSLKGGAWYHYFASIWAHPLCASLSTVGGLWWFVNFSRFRDELLPFTTYWLRIFCP